MTDLAVFRGTQAWGPWVQEIMERRRRSCAETQPVNIIEGEVIKVVQADYVRLSELAKEARFSPSQLRQLYRAIKRKEFDATKQEDGHYYICTREVFEHYRRRLAIEETGRER